MGVGVEKDGGTASRRGVEPLAFVARLGDGAGGCEALLCVLALAASGAGDPLPLLLGLLLSCRLSAGNPYPPLSRSPPGLGGFSPAGETAGLSCVLPGLVLGALALSDCPRGRRWMKLSARPKRFCAGAEGELGRGTGWRGGEGR